jgi:hypothetical protein
MAQRQNVYASNDSGKKYDSRPVHMKQEQELG